jgi:hypothetical protein
MLQRIRDKLQYAHPYDGSDLTDLYSDILNRKKIGLIERLKRKVKYTYKTLIYFLTTFSILMMYGQNAQALIGDNTEVADYSAIVFVILVILGIVVIPVVLFIFERIDGRNVRIINSFGKEYYNTKPPTKPDTYIPPPPPKKYNDI